MNYEWFRLFGGLAVIIFIVRFVLATPFKNSEWIEKIIIKYGGITGYGLFITFLIGIGITCAVHSSSLSTWTMFGLVSSGMIPIHTGIAFVIGANIGTTIDAFIATMIFKDPSTRIVALSQIMFNVLSAAIWFPLFLLLRGFIPK